MTTDANNVTNDANDANIFGSVPAHPVFAAYRYGYMTLDSIFAGDTPISVDDIRSVLTSGKGKKASTQNLLSEIAAAMDGFILDVEVSMLRTSCRQ